MRVGVGSRAAREFGEFRPEGLVNGWLSVSLFGGGEGETGIQDGSQAMSWLEVPSNR